MDLDVLIVRYFGTDDLGSVSEAMLAAGLDRLRVDFAMERDRGRRFRLWALMHMLSVAPDLDRPGRASPDQQRQRSHSRP